MGRQQARHKTIGDVDFKFCTTCRKWKPTTDFHKNPINSDGLRGKCKACLGVVNPRGYYRRAARVEAGLYSVCYDPLKRWSDQIIMTSMELANIIRKDRLAIGAKLERQDGSVFRLTADGRLKEI